MKHISRVRGCEKMGNSFFTAPFLSLLVEEGNSANQALIIAAVFSSLLIVIMPSNTDKAEETSQCR